MKNWAEMWWGLHIMQNTEFDQGWNFELFLFEEGLSVFNFDISIFNIMYEQKMYHGGHFCWILPILFHRLFFSSSYGNSFWLHSDQVKNGYRTKFWPIEYIGKSTWRHSRKIFLRRRPRCSSRFFIFLIRSYVNMRCNGRNNCTRPVTSLNVRPVCRMAYQKVNVII